MFNIIIIHIIILIVCAIFSKIILNFSYEKIIPIASSITTLVGILFGFLITSVSILLSLKDNKVVRNYALINFIPDLAKDIYITICLLLITCFIFLIILFIPPPPLFLSLISFFF